MRTCFFVILSLSLLATGFMPFEKDGVPDGPVVLARHRPAPNPALYEAGFRFSLATPGTNSSEYRPTPAAPSLGYMPHYQAGPDPAPQDLVEVRRRELQDLMR
jgi:hypothetical protein